MGRFGAVYQSVAAIPIVFYGFAFHRAFTSLRYVAAFELSGNAVIPSFLFAFALAAVVRVFGSDRVRKAVLPVGVSAQLLSCVPLVLLHFGGIADPILLMLGGVFSSISTVALSALWIDQYAMLNPVRAVWCGSVAILIAQLLVFFVEQSSERRLVIALVAASVLSAATYIVAARSGDTATDGKRHAVEASDRFDLPYKAMFFIGAYSFAYGFAMVRDDLLNMRYVSVIPCLIAMVFLLINDRKFNVSVLIRFAFPLMVTGFLLIFFVADAEFAPAAIVINAGFSTMEVLLMFIVCTISYSMGVSALWLFGIFLGLQSLMRLVGAQLGDLLSMYVAMPFRYEIVGVAAIVCVGVASLALASEKTLFTCWRFSRSMGERSEAGSDSVRARIGNLGELYKLTDREKEVFYLLAQGKSNIEIAHDMIISEGTVKAHLHHIYRKFGVNRRRDLLAFIERE